MVHIISFDHKTNLITQKKELNITVRLAIVYDRISRNEACKHTYRPTSVAHFQY